MNNIDFGIKACHEQARQKVLMGKAQKEQIEMTQCLGRLTKPARLTL